jgi:hypothetical protein
MKKLVSLLLVATLSLSIAGPCWSQAADSTAAAPAAGLSQAECQERGITDGKQAASGGAFAIGLVSGAALGLVGTLIAWLATGDADPSAAALGKLETAECRMAYTESFQKESKKKKKRSALIGGLIGTGVAVAIIVSTADSGN